MKTKFLLLILCYLFFFPSLFGQRKMEDLDRGTIAIKTNDGVYVSWRVKGTEWYGVSYNIYRDGVKINDVPIAGATNFLDEAGALTSTYCIKAIVNNIEQSEQKAVAVLSNPYIEFKLREIAKIEGVPDECYNAYRINDMTAADLDGDGEYELIVKRINKYFDAANPYLNKYYNLIEAYKIDGTHLWTIDLGPNIFHDHEINVLAYDFDGDGKAEIVMRSSEGTVDGVGNIIGDVADGSGEMQPDGVIDYRNDMKSNGGHTFERYGIEFLSLYDGMTGKELDRIQHIPREPFEQWGSAGMKGGQLAHRATKFHYGAPYLDGKTPSVFISRGIYTRIKMRTYDVVNKKFKFKWAFDSEDGNHPGYSYQGYHNYVIADVDNDGCDEIVYGSMTIDHNGEGLYTTELGHGDAMHVSNFDPYRKGLEIWACLESSPQYGSVFRAGESNEILWHRTAGRDMGRCMAANITDKYKGAEMWDNDHMYSASERKALSLARGTTAFRIYWDGDLLEELASRGSEGPSNNGSKWMGQITKYNETTGAWNVLLEANRYYTCNDTKGTPCLQADLLGDWREEIIYRSEDDQSIRIYMTTISTSYRFYTLMHDMQYRQAIAWQMCGYNQPPHPSFFVGKAENILLPPPPVIDNQRLVLQPNAVVWNFSEPVWTKDGMETAYTDGEDVLFDFLTMDSSPVELSSSVKPGNVFINSSGKHILTAANGKLSGSMRMLKQGMGTFSLNGTHDYTGSTEIWDGLLDLEGTLERSFVYVHLFGEFAVKGVIGEDTEMRYGSRLYPGRKKSTGTVTFNKNLKLSEQADVVIDLGSGLTQHDKIIVKGDFDFSKGIRFFINRLDDTLVAGEYAVIEVDGIITGNESSISIIENDNTISAIAKVEENKVILSVSTITHAEVPVISVQPRNQAANIGDQVGLSVNASVNDGGTLSYQWYSNTTNSNIGGTAIGSAKAMDYTPVTYTAKKTWYYVIVTNTNSASTGNKTASVTSEVVAVTVLSTGLAENVIANPSFEQGSSFDGLYNVPNGWLLNVESTGTMDVTLKGTQASHGSYRFYIWCEGVDNVIDLYQNVLLPKGRYTLKADLKPGSPSSTSLYASVGDVLSESLAPSASSWTKWGETELSFAVPENSTPVRIGVSATAMIMYDNFQLISVGSSVVQAIDISFAGLYPNPTTGFFTLDFAQTGRYGITVSDMTGMVVVHQILAGKTIQIDISSYPVGIYLLTIECNGRKSTRKIIKEC